MGKRIEYFDLLKFFAIFFVIIYHFNTIDIDFINNGSINTHLNYYLKSFLCVCVPLFFFISGAILLNHNEEINLKKHIKKTIKIIGLFLIWTTITILFLNAIWTNYDSIGGYFSNLISKSNFDAYTTLKKSWNNHLWYLGVLFILYVFYPLIHLAFTKKRSIFNYFLVIVLIFSFGITLIADIRTIISSFDTFNYYHYTNYGYMFNPFGHSTAYSLGYFMLGGLLFEKREKFASKKYKVFAGIIILIAITALFFYGRLISKMWNGPWDNVFEAYNSIPAVVSTIALFIIFMNYKSRTFIGKLFCSIGSQTLGIYFIHILIGSYIINYWYKLGNYININSFFINLLLAFIILMISYGISLGISKIPFIKNIVKI